MKKTNHSNGNGRSNPNGIANGGNSSNGHSSKNNGVSKSRTRSSGSKSAAHADDLGKVMKNAIKDPYYAEKQLVKALNKLSKSAHNEELKDGFELHRQETEEHVEKLEQVFEILGMRAVGKKCPAMDGLIEEGAEAIEEYDKGPARDAALIVSAQKVEHYEIAAYGSVRTFAEVLGYDECMQILDGILDQESATDKKLTQIAGTVNAEALFAGEDAEAEAMEFMTHR